MKWLIRKTLAGVACVAIFVALVADELNERAHGRGPALRDHE